mgnify:FL=1
MTTKNYSGLFIAFEGLDGSGSVIQASLLSGALKKEGYRVYATKEPTGGLIGGLIRAQISGEWSATDECLQLLFAADRADHLKKEIIPNLNNGKIVITDRYTFSSIAYGSVKIDNTNWLKQINQEFITPDITFLIKVSPKICAMRLRKTSYDVELYRTEQKLRKAWDTYEKLANNSRDIYVIDGERDEMVMMKEMLDIVRKKLGV